MLIKNIFTEFTVRHVPYFYQKNSVLCSTITFKFSTRNETCICTILKSRLHGKFEPVTWNLDTYKFMIHAFFYKQHLLWVTRGWNLQKIMQMLSNIFSYLKISHTFHPRFHPKIIGRILRNKLRKTKVPLFKWSKWKWRSKWKIDHIDTA